jgi:thiol-disulfide isomerase/thioredoxin
MQSDRNCFSTMRTLLVRLVLLVMVTGAFAGCFSNTKRYEALIGRPVPDARLMMLDGSQHALKSQVGKAIAFLFWSTSCAFSRSAIEDFEELARLYEGRDNLRFIAVSVDSESALGELESRIKEQDLRTVEHVFSGNEGQDEVFLAFNGDRIPYVVFVDARGIVRLAELGTGGLERVLDAHFTLPRQ